MMNNVLVASIFSKLKRAEAQLEGLENKSFQLIEEITVDKDNIAVIERNKEPNGNAYSFEEVFIAFETEASGSNTTLTCRANNVVSVGISDLIGTEKKYCTLQFQVNKGLLFTTYQIPATDKTWANSVRARNAEILFAEAINSLRFTCNTPIPSGTKIIIYAVRK
ncbi:MAG: hypothetical protein II233_07245 [Clostridia bacterium]|nr:hypothetical protein [Clostridia bacterium]